MALVLLRDVEVDSGGSALRPWRYKTHCSAKAHKLERRTLGHGNRATVDGFRVSAQKQYTAY